MLPTASLHFKSDTSGAHQPSAAALPRQATFTPSAYPARVANMSEEPRKRSRFDKEPEAEPAPRKSRFDRRSRSPAPPNDRDDRARTRSPVKSTESPGNDEAQDAAARAAAAVAARINASIQNKKAPQHVDVPPIRSVCGHNTF